MFLHAQGALGNTETVMELMEVSHALSLFQFNLAQKASDHNWSKIVDELLV